MIPIGSSRRANLAFVLATTLVGCSGSSAVPDNGSNPWTGGTAQGGQTTQTATTSGGSVSALGGTSAGGSVGLGSAQTTGGTAPVGGATANSGAASIGGASAQGGTSAGGASNQGGTPSGGNAVGGATVGGATVGGAAAGGAARGGSTTGGAGLMGGAANGGVSNRGGTSAGGTLPTGGSVSTTGGVSPGGSTAVGGATTAGRCSGGDASGRIMDCLARGVVVVNQGSGKAFISWRLLGTEAQNTGFNVYRQIGTGTTTKLNSAVLSGGTNYQDTSASFTSATTYCVRPVTGGLERAQSSEDCFSLPANSPVRDYVSIPLRAASSDAFVHLAWPGDLDGDGEYDIVVDRISAASPLVDAYNRNGAFLWRFDTGPNGADQNNIEGGASTMSNGMWDGLTVYDLDSDGKAEVAIKTAPGVVFGDGTTLAGSDATQYVSILQGSTGKELARAALPTDYASDGPLQCQFNVGYLDGLKPSLVIKCKNRVGSGAFNLLIVAYDYAGGKLTQRWKYLRGNQSGASDYHQQRIVDVDGDGRDEVADGGYVVDENGKYLYGVPGAVHGDRFHIGDLDPDRPGLEGFGIQQDNASGLQFYYYDAKTGAVLRSHTGDVTDMARGIAADIDPRHRGYEYWTFGGYFNVQELTTGPIVADPDTPWPNFRIWWDGDALSEMLNQAYVAKWDYSNPGRKNFVFKKNLPGLYQARDAVPFYGDILGDWREEVVLESSDHTAINVVTTTYASDIRLYTLAHNPEYRNGMTTQGYRQSLMVDYYLGDGMTTPPNPKIRMAPRIP